MAPHSSRGEAIIYNNVYGVMHALINVNINKYITVHLTISLLLQNCILFTRPKKYIETAQTCS